MEYEKQKKKVLKLLSLSNSVLLKKEVNKLFKIIEEKLCQEEDSNTINIK